MAVDIGPRIGIDGEKQFRSELQNINQQIKTLGSEMKEVTSAFGENANAETKLANKTKNLTQQIEAQQKKIKLLEEVLQKSAQKFGENDTNTLKWRQALADAKTTLNGMQSELSQTMSGVDKLGDEMSASSEQGGGLLGKLQGLGGAAVVAGITAAFAAVKKLGEALYNCAMDAAQAADEVLTLSAQTGLTTDQIQSLQYMSELVDTDLSTLQGSLIKLTRNMYSAKDGTGTAAEAFSALGVSITNSDGSLRNNWETFIDLIDALGQVSNETERDALAMQIFGKSAQDLNPLILAGKDVLAQYSEEAAKYYNKTPEELAILGELDDAWQKVKLSFKAVKDEIGLQLAPTLTSLFDGMSEGLRNTRDGIKNFSEDASTLFAQAREDVGAWAASWQEKFATAKQNAIENWQEIKSRWSESGNFFAGVAQSIRTAFQSLPQWAQNVFSTMVNTVKNLFSGLVSWVQGIISGLRHQSFVADYTINQTVRTTTAYEEAQAEKFNSHALGLDYVPYNGYLAELHKGETILTATEAAAYRNLQKVMTSAAPSAAQAFGGVAAQILNGMPTALAGAGGGSYNFDIRVMLDNNTQLARKVFTLSQQGAKQAGLSYTG